MMINKALALTNELRELSKVMLEFFYVNTHTHTHTHIKLNI